MNVFESYLLEFKWVFYNSIFNQSKFKDLKSLKNSKKGKNVFLFGNGPSLNKLSSDKILKYKNFGWEVFSINSFVRSEFFPKIQPDHYHIADPAHFLDFKSSNISEKYKELARIDHELICGLNCNLYVPINQFNKIDYFKKFAITHICNPHKKGIGSVFTSFGHSTMTAYNALSLCIFLGFDNIYICGIDNNWFKSLFVDENNDLYYDHNHFYDQSSSYNKKLRIDKLDGKNVGEYLKIQTKLFSDLYRFNFNNIINLDKLSLVDAFSKKHELDIYN